MVPPQCLFHSYCFAQKQLPVLVTRPWSGVMLSLRYSVLNASDLAWKSVVQVTNPVATVPGPGTAQITEGGASS